MSNKLENKIIIFKGKCVNNTLVQDDNTEVQLVKLEDVFLAVVDILERIQHEHQEFLLERVNEIISESFKDVDQVKRSSKDPIDNLLSQGCEFGELRK